MKRIHFIGGPWHGETREELKPAPTIKGIEVELPKVEWCTSPAAYIPRMCETKEFEYRRMSPDAQAGYILYRFVEPPAEVITVTIEVTVSQNAEERAAMAGFYGPGGVKEYLTRRALGTLFNSHCASQVQAV